MTLRRDQPNLVDERKEQERLKFLRRCDSRGLIKRKGPAMNKRRLWIASITIELLGIVVASAGLGVELALHAEIGYGLITAGSLCIAGGGILWGKLARMK